MPVSESSAQTIAFCRVVLNGDQPVIDFIPQSDTRYVAPLPDDAIISRNEKELSAARYAVFISPHSAAGRLMAQLLKAKNT